MTKHITGIILTAGTGSRLGAATSDRPKGMVEVNGRPMLDYNIRFLKEVGVTKIIAVAGFNSEKVKKYLAEKHSDVAAAENFDYLKGNLFSLKSALKDVSGSFLVCNADHLYKLPIAQVVRKQCAGITAFCDFDRKLQDDDMKVLLDSQKNLVQISKSLQKFDAGYVGLTFCEEQEREAYNRAFDAVAKKFGEKAVVEQVLGELALEGSKVAIGDISGFGWLEVDFPHELEAARSIVSQNLPLFIS